MIGMSFPAAIGRNGDRNRTHCRHFIPDRIELASKSNRRRGETGRLAMAIINTPVDRLRANMEDGGREGFRSMHRHRRVALVPQHGQGVDIALAFDKLARPLQPGARRRRDLLALVRGILVNQMVGVT